jgi:hypothetical protein
MNKPLFGRMSTHRTARKCFIVINLLLTAIALTHVYTVLAVPLVSRFSLAVLCMAIGCNAVAIVFHCTTEHSSAQGLVDYGHYLIGVRFIVFVVEWALYYLYLHTFNNEQHSTVAGAAIFATIAAIYGALLYVERRCGISHRVFGQPRRRVRFHGLKKIQPWKWKYLD